MTCSSMCNRPFLTVLYGSLAVDAGPALPVQHKPRVLKVGVLMHCKTGVLFIYPQPRLAVAVKAQATNSHLEAGPHQVSVSNSRTRRGVGSGSAATPCGAILQQ